MTRKALLAAVKQAVLEVEPAANILLYGSRACGRAGSESDWDFLVLVDGAVDAQRKRRIRRRLYDIEWDSGHVLTSIVLDRGEWEEGVKNGVPFPTSVSQQSVAL